MPYLVKISTVLDIVHKFDNKLRFQGGDIEDEVENLISELEDIPNYNNKNKLIKHSDVENLISSLSWNEYDKKYLIEEISKLPESVK